MIAVIFEVTLHPHHKATYLEIAAQLKKDLQHIDGFISVERFQSLANDKKILSLSFFENEAAVANWRQMEQHRQTQKAGRQTLFADYRLQVAAIKRDYGKNERDQVPDDGPIPA